MRYGLRVINLEAFLGSMDSTASGLAATDSRLGIEMADLPAISSYPLAPGYPTPGQPILLRPSFARTHKYVNISTFPISYAFQPCLRGRLTLGRLPLPRKPWVTANRFFTCFIVTHVSIITSPQSSMPYDTPSAREERSPTRPHMRNSKLRYHA